MTVVAVTGEGEGWEKRGEEDGEGMLRNIDETRQAKDVVLDRVR